MNANKNRKVIFLGDVGVGKTSLIHRIVNNTFDSNYSETIGVDFLTKTIYKDNQILKVEFWDTAGQEKFKSLMPSYIRNCSVAVIIFDISRQKTFEHVRDWVKIVREEGQTIECIVVGNKTDLTREVIIGEGKELAEELGLGYVESSALNGEGIDVIANNIFLGLPSTVTKRGQALSQTTKQHKSCGCL